MASKVMTSSVDEAHQKDREAQSPNIASLINDVSQTLGNIDFEHSLAMMNLEVSRSSDDQKRFIRGKLVAQHRERREPYVTLLSELRRHLQHFSQAV
jgi:hypothetical protein